MKYISSLRDGDRLNDVYLCKFKQSAVTKNGKTYENVILQDKTGTLDGKIWDPNNAGIEDFSAMDYIYVSADVSNYQGQLQASIKRVRAASEGDYLPDDYVPVSEKDRGEMYQELLGILGTVKNEYLTKLINLYFRDNPSFIKEFQIRSAAKSIHHAFVGGLLEHTLAVVKMCDFYSVQYPVLNRDLLLTAAAFHDVGKLNELSSFPENEYTDDGQLLGHIFMGAERIRIATRRIPDFPKKLANELCHCILAHHGELEYGSPKKPAIMEAVALNMADNTDAKLESFKEAVSASPEGQDWLGYNKWFESNIRRTSES